MKRTRLHTCLLLAVLICCFAKVSAQSEPEDSCTRVMPKFTASFDGIQARGMLSADDLGKIRKVKPEEAGVTIIRFTYLIDCGEDCDMRQKVVYEDTFSEDDTKAIQAMKSRNILSLECILGKDKDGKLISFKPFLYYIR